VFDHRWIHCAECPTVLEAAAAAAGRASHPPPAEDTTMFVKLKKCSIVINDDFDQMTNEVQTGK
jgi:hypothetical protein